MCIRDRSCKEVVKYNEGAGKKVVLVDCGVKANIIRSLVKRGVEVISVPWNYDYTAMSYDGLFLANGPGDPDTCQAAVDVYKRQVYTESLKPMVCFHLVVLIAHPQVVCMARCTN